MKKYRISFFLFSLFMFHCGQDGKNLMNYDAQTHPWSQVYETILDSMFIDSQTGTLVIRDSTDTWSHLDPTYVWQEFHMMDSSTFSDFIYRNQQSLPVKACMNPPVRTIFLTDSTFRSIMASGGWDAFYDIYPNSSGYLSFSSPGFNEYNTQALLYVSFMYHYLAGAGYLILLTRESAWKIRKVITVWIS